MKYLVAGAVLTGKPFERGDQTGQDLDLLFKIRNAIVHLEPSIFTVGGEKGFSMSCDKLVEQLRQRKVLPDLPAGHVMIFLHRLAERSVARWAVNTTVQAVMAIVSALPDGQFKDSVVSTYRQGFVEID